MVSLLPAVGLVARLNLDRGHRAVEALSDRFDSGHHTVVVGCSGIGLDHDFALHFFLYPHGLVLGPFPPGLETLHQHLLSCHDRTRRGGTALARWGQRSMGLHQVLARACLEACPVAWDTYDGRRGHLEVRPGFAVEPQRTGVGKLRVGAYPWLHRQNRLLVGKALA